MKKMCEYYLTIDTFEQYPIIPYQLWSIDNEKANILQTNKCKKIWDNNNLDR